jgi:hypothetical protein
MPDGGMVQWNSGHPKIWKYGISFKWIYLKCHISYVEPTLSGPLRVSDVMVMWGPCGDEMDTTWRLHGGIQVIEPCH